MLAFIPIFLLGAAAAAIFVLSKVRRGFGASWLTALAASVLCWLFLLIAPFKIFKPFLMENWLPVDGYSMALSFQLDAVSWPFALALLALMICLILSDSSRLDDPSGPVVWAGGLGITAVCLVAVLASSPLALAIAWTLLDLIELILFLITVRESKPVADAILAFCIRIGGTMILLWAMIAAGVQGYDLSLASIPGNIAIYMILAAGLRLGVFPVHLPFQEDASLRRRLGTILRLSPVASSLVLLARLPAQALTGVAASILLVFAVTAMIFGAIAWLLAKDEIHGRPYWVIGTAGIVLVCSILGVPTAGMSWSLVLLLGGGFLFFFSHRSIPMLALALISFLAMTGLPGTPNAGGWTGIFPQPFHAAGIFSIFSVILLFLGFVRHTMTPGEPYKALPRWAKALYPLGLFILPVSHWMTMVRFLPSSFTTSRWWLSLPVTLLVIALVAAGERRLRQAGGISVPVWLETFGNRVGGTLSAFVQLRWVYRIFDWFYGIIQSFIRFLTTILEGEGGVLWALVLLVLLITLLGQGGTN